MIKDRAMTELLRKELVAAELGMSTAIKFIANIRKSSGIRGRDHSGMTSREAEVLGCIAEGMSNADIADHLTISENTVEA